MMEFVITEYGKHKQYGLQNNHGSGVNTTENASTKTTMISPRSKKLGFKTTKIKNASV